MKQSNLWQSLWQSLLLRILIICAVTAGLNSCESSTSPQGGGTSVVTTKSVFLLNEGSFGKQDASLDLYVPSTGSITHNIIPNLGDVGNDVKLLNGVLYVVLNGSGKIYAIRADTVKKIDSIEFQNGEAPNVIAQSAPTQAIVTQLYNPNAVILDLQSNKVTGAIQIGSGSVGVALLDNRAFISSGSDSLNVCNIGTNTVAQVIKVGDDPQTVIADSAHDQIAVLCWGDYGEAPSSVYFVNASTLQVTDSLHFPGGSFMQSLIKGSNLLYAVVGDSVASIDLATRKITNAAFIATTSPYYNGGFDVASNELYLGVTNYNGNSSVDVFDATSGTKKRSFAAGIAPAHFAFYR
jgi:hypothetical protein